MEDGVTLNVPSFTSLLFSLFSYFFVSRPSTYGVGTGFYHLRRLVKWRWRFLARRIRRKVALSGTDWLWDLCVRTFAYVERLLDCFLSFLLLYGFMQPRESAPKEGDNVMARLHKTCPGPGSTSIIYCRLATSLRSLSIILPLYYSTILTSMLATVSYDRTSYEAIYGRTPLYALGMSVQFLLVLVFYDWVFTAWRLEYLLTVSVQWTGCK